MITKIKEASENKVSRSLPSFLFLGNFIAFFSPVISCLGPKKSKFCLHKERDAQVNFMDRLRFYDGLSLCVSILTATRFEDRA